ncbi:MAG: FAD-binding oxidoreductase [Alphaproteobacteria bacterium]|nr:FAD-binding oxidoreductase [Alphaproteobacteria bacterium]
MTDVFDAIVIGAGIFGACTAYQLKKQGAGRVLLIDRDRPASGVTGRSAGIVRQQYAHPLPVALARHAIDLFKVMPTELDADFEYVQSGHCFLIGPDALEAVQRNLAMQRQLGIDTTLVAGLGMHDLTGPLIRDGIAAVLYEKLAGYINPTSATEAHVAAFTRMGGILSPGTPVRSLSRVGDRITGIVTDGGPIEANLVINAAGPWAAALAASADIPMKLTVAREQVTTWRASQRQYVPVAPLASGPDGIYLRPMGNQFVMVGRSFPKESEIVDPLRYKTSPDPETAADIRTRIHRRFHALADAAIASTRTLLCDDTADHYPYVGPRTGLAGYADACGGGSHGFKLAPAIAHELARWILTGRAEDDFADLSYDRLERGKLFATAQDIAS